MKQKTIVSILLLICLLGCKKEEKADNAPIASFYFKKVVVTPYESVEVDNYSTNAYSYKWEDETGTISTAKNPTFSWKNEGTHTIKLTAIGFGGSNSTERNITVKN